MSEPPKPETIAFEMALKNELLHSGISEIPVNDYYTCTV